MPLTLYFLLWISIVVFAATFLFTEGFLLARHELRANNTRTEFAQQYDRVVLIVVDALRFDFVYFNTSLRDDEKNFYHNQLSVLHELIQKAPDKARLFKFLADPPTVTMQRLKGLTTGGLPTFIDVKDNFASSAITEDNLISQLARHGRKVVMMGDDTWVSLFPTEFAQSFPFPSFNVKDLHTVDNGVLTHLLPSILRSDEEHNTKWDVLIAHFLGVDHVGHRYGPVHQWMTNKLRQMNAVISHVVCAIDSNCSIGLQPIPSFEGVQAALPNVSHADQSRTLLVVMGDHGMTQQGEHGGATNDEVGAGMFVYSSYPIFSQNLVIPSRQGLSRERLWSGEEYATIPQIDLVPTLSLLLGLPIPYGNLGALIPELFVGHQTSLDSSSRLEGYRGLMKALYENSGQVWQYLVAYSNLSSTFGADTMASFATEMETASDAYHKASTEEDVLRLITHLQSFLTRASTMCREKWTRFDLHSMGSAIGLLAVGWLCLLWLGRSIAWPSLRKGLFVAAAGACVSVVLSFVFALRLSVVVALVVGSSLISGLSDLRIFPVPNVREAISWRNAVALFCCAIYMQGLFSNSFIVAEHNVAIFLTTTVWLTTSLDPFQLLAGVLARTLGKGSNFSPDASLASLSGLEEVFCIGSCLALACLPPYLVRQSLKGVQYLAVAALCVLQALAILGFWSGFGRLLLPRFVYLTSLLGLGYLLLCRKQHPAQLRSTLTFAVFAGPLVLLLGPLSPALVLVLAGLVACLCLSPSAKPTVTFSEVVFLYFVIVSLFYATGHRMGFESIPASCAFVGFDEFNLYLGGLFVVLHCFSGHILGTLGLAILLSHRQQANGPHRQPEPNQPTTNQKRKQQEAFFAPISSPLVQMSLLFSLRLLCTMVNVTIQRRHLMVWAIFAPKYVFDCLTAVCMQVLLLLAQVLLGE